MRVERSEENGFFNIARQKIKKGQKASILKELFMATVYFVTEKFYVIFYYYLFFYVGVLLCQYKSHTKPIVDYLLNQKA